MADDPSDSGYRKSVLTFRPDNFLTVGLIGLVAYLFAVLVVQGLMRAGLVSSQGPAATASIPNNGAVSVV
jgi:hypothetical protein